MTKFFINNASMVAAFISSVALVGWLTDHAALAALLPDIANMTFNTALCFTLLTLVFWQLNRDYAALRTPGKIIILFVALLAMLSLLQDMFSVSFGIDNLLFDSHGFGLSSPHPGRMPFITAAGFLFSGIILFSLTRDKKLTHSSTITHALTLLVGMIGLLGIAMNLLMREAPEGYVHFASISMFTAILFLLLSIALLGVFERKIVGSDPVLYSGIHLMYHLKYPQKFFLISIIFIIPLTILMWSEIRRGEKDIGVARLEIHGIDDVQLNADLFKAVQEHRGMMNARFSSSGIFRTALSKKTKQIDQLFIDNDRMAQLYARHMIPEDWLKITSLWVSIKKGHMDQLQQWRAHTEMITLLTRHMRNMAEETRLAFEADPVLHNLLAMQLEVMPDLFEGIGQLRGQGAGFLGNNTISKDGQLMLGAMVGQVKLQLETLERDSGLPMASQDIQTLHPLFDAFTAQVRVFLVATEQRLIRNQTPSIATAKYFQMATSAIEKGYAFNNASLEYIAQQLQQRITNSTTTQYNIKLAAMLLLLILLFLFASFYKSVINTIRALDETSERMRNGNTGERVELLAKDELGDVAHSFNAIAEELMRVSSHMSAVVNHAVDGIITIDQHGGVKSFNPAAEHMFGYIQSEVIGRDITMLMPEQYRQRHKAGLQHYWQTQQGRVVGTSDSIEVQGLKKDGSEFPMELSINTMFIDEQQMFIGMVRDVSKHHELEKQLRHAQKMQAVGVLVGGVAHNFNNLLAGIVGKAYMGKKRVRQDLQVIPYLESITEIAQQAGEMVKQLLAFSHRDFSQNKQSMPLEVIIKEAFATAKLGIEENINLSLHIIGSDMMAYCDANQLQQVLMNMMNNARDAVADSAKKCMAVSLERYEPDAGFFHRHPELTPGEYASLSISDSGYGMDVETMEKIFDPFFTSKGVGKGTGLGLSSAFGSITSHGGAIEVDSAMGEGTTFRVYLPLIKAVEAHVDHDNHAHVVDDPNHELLLLVDDEPIVLQSTQEVLEDLGYAVITAENGVEGLECFKQDGHNIAAIITDVVMPEMGGVEMFREIRRINTAIPIIFITGYDQGKVNLQADEKKNTMIISKPVPIPALSQAIQKILSATI